MTFFVLLCYMFVSRCVHMYIHSELYSTAQLLLQFPKGSASTVGHWYFCTPVFLSFSNLETFSPYHSAKKDKALAREGGKIRWIGSVKSNLYYWLLGILSHKANVKSQEAYISLWNQAGATSCLPVTLLILIKRRFLDSAGMQVFVILN